MTTTHDLKYPSFDPSWTWSGASLLLKTSDHLVLLKRSFEMPTHRGQMGFFAGHKKESELHPFEVAKREFEEESSIDPQLIHYEGVLNPVYTSKGLAIVPVVGKLSLSIDDLFKHAVSNGEWTDLIAVPWKNLLEPSSWEWAELYGTNKHKILLFPIAPETYLHQRSETSQSFMLWGATARMVWEYLCLYYQEQ